MNLNQPLLAELKHEAASTRKMLERIPSAQLGYQPHSKSMSMARLATHVAELTGWLSMTLNTPELNFATFDRKPVIAETSEQLLQMFDDNLAQSIGALESATNDQLMTNWVLRNGDHIIMDMPRVAIIRSMVMNHLIHHRGQLSVYLRLNNIPVPGMYGPSADDHAPVPPATSDAQLN